MPGFSLWLVPPANSPIRATLSALIAESLPAQFPATDPPSFVPHVTLTADVALDVFSHPSRDEERQKRDAHLWLDGLPLPGSTDVSVRFEALDVGEKFVQKLTLRVAKEQTGSLREFARVSRLHGVERGGDEQAVEAWLDGTYRPHCSLLYGSMPISDQKKAELQNVIERAGVSITGFGELGGWEGGLVWLVPTFKKIPEWEPWVEKIL